MTRFQPRKQLFDYQEAEETQYDMVNAVEQAGSLGSGLERFYSHQDKKMKKADQGGFWGQFSQKAVEAQKPEYDTLSSAIKAVKGLTGDKQSGLQGKINTAMKAASDWGGQTSAWKTQNPLIDAIAGKKGSGLLGALEKIPGVGEFAKNIAGKVAGSGIGSMFASANAIAAPFMLAKGIHKMASGISDADKKLAGQEHDVGIAGKAIQQSGTTANTQLHDVMRASVNRVKEGGSDLNQQYGATALKVLSSQDIATGKSNLESSDLQEGSQEDVMNSLTTQRISAGDNLVKQANYQMEQGVGQYVDATSSLLGQYQQNQKLASEIGDQRDKMSGMVKLARMVPFVS